MKNSRKFSLRLISVSVAMACFVSYAVAGNEWGDDGNGMYHNPVLPIDYSDPDVIRVGDTYYMVASDFHFMGMQVMKSKDLVNWKIISQIYDHFDFPGWDTNSHYAGGSWAPALRYHDGKFWVFFCTPDEGLFMSNAEHAEGPWSPLHLVQAVKKWEDPCPFWDEDGQAYLGRSKYGAGPIIIHKMSPDGKRLLDDGKEVYRGPIAEGTKFHKLNGYYYLSIPEGGVGQGWQTCLRSKNIYGPYERRVVLERGSTKVNGPHQGSLVDTPDGKWWFIHFQELSPLGRVVHLQPMEWCDGWPVIGRDLDGNGIGEPVDHFSMPKGENIGNDFRNISGFGLHWQWNHNPVPGKWSIDNDRQTLTLNAMRSDNFKSARNTFTQKVVGYKGAATVQIDLRKMADGQRCGLACMGKQNMMIGIERSNGELFLYEEHNDAIVMREPYHGKKITLTIETDTKRNAFYFEYGKDSRHLTKSAHIFAMSNGFWNGARVALYSYNTERDGGTCVFSKFSYVNE